MIPDIHWDSSVWFFDIDDTLIDTAGATSDASEVIYQLFTVKYPESTARNIQLNFLSIFQLMMTGYRVKDNEEWKAVEGGKDAFDNLLSRIEATQTRVKAEYGAIKKWSREVFIKLAMEDAKVAVTKELVHEAANAYWLKLTELTTVYLHALELINRIRDHKRPIYLITSSDGRLTMAEDGFFDYDPPYSEALKKERTRLLKDKGVIYNNISIGDPEDKPHPDFFQKGIRLAEKDLGKTIDLKNAVMVGDSFSGDLQTPKENMFFGLVVLFQKDKDGTDVIDSRQINTGNLADVTRYVK